MRQILPGETRFLRCCLTSSMSLLRFFALDLAPTFFFRYLFSPGAFVMFLLILLVL